MKTRTSIAQSGTERSGLLASFRGSRESYVIAAISVTGTLLVSGVHPDSSLLRFVLLSSWIVGLLTLTHLWESLR